eukprot:CAMPEP_0176485608 /NCGR_PEP_ID=MMETSP0200_2-20121128/5128_1 /TAXON_ID=947934 /ORGANISM="Chaetoceros sp., Strain GSL56" /LENGTH=448 /DNA_ID=CAMNT_0017882259 /DNA_START=154 /DNA_END=1500 /DNA_ORIENTATION=+
MGCTGSKGKSNAVTASGHDGSNNNSNNNNHNIHRILPQDHNGRQVENNIDQEVRRRDDKITALQEEDRKQNEQKVKLLLLGTGESGKSTIFKQMRILYGSPLTDDDLRMYGVIVRSNIVTAIRKLCLLARQLGYERRLDEESAAATAADLSDVSGMTPREAYDQIVTYLVDNVATEPFPEIPAEQAEKDWVGKSTRAGIQANRDAQQFLQHVEAIRVLWQSATMQEVWMRRAQANINDSHNIYLSDLTRIAHVNYIPSEYDILISRVRTTQVTVERYTIDGIQFEVYDVGGQRSERRKWIGCFENVDAVIFVAALSEYDQTLAESRRQNRMMEALNLFESVVKNEHFADTSIMLFLNKKDVFAEKIMYSNIADSPFFSDYAGPPQDFDHGVLYFIQKFEEHLGGDEFNDSFIHVTCATDTNNMEFVLDSSRTIIMTDNLRRAGFLGTD